MKKINLKIFRNLLQMKLHSLTIALTIACGIGVYSGVDMAMKSLYYTRDKIFSDLNFADLEVNLIPEDVQNLPDLSNIPGVEKVERRLAFPGVMYLPNSKKILATMIFLENLNPEINRINLVKGEGLEAGNLENVIAEKTLYDVYGIKPGDNIKVKVGEKIYENKVKGIGISPEFVIATANADYYLPEKGSLGVLFTSIKRVDENLGFTMVNDLIFKFIPGVDHNQVKEEIIKRLKNVHVEKIIPYRDNFAYKYLELDLNAFRIYVPAIVVVLGSLSFIITLINFSRLIVHERREIGAMLAIGYNRRTIIFSYFLGGLSLGCIGIILGIPFLFALRNAFTHIYGSAHSLILIYNRVFAISIVKGVCFGLLASGISSALPAYNILRFNPCEIIHPPLKNSILKSKAFLTKVFKFTLFFPVGSRMGIRNIFRHKLVSIATIFSVALSIGVAISYIISMSSLRTTIVKRFERQNWDMIVDFLYPVYFEDYNEIKTITGVKNVEPYFRYYAEVGKNGHFEGTGLFGVVTPSKMLFFPIIEGENVRKKDEILINIDLAKKLKVKTGDTVELKIREKIYPFKICGIESDVTQGETVIDFYRAREILEFSDEAFGVMVNAGKPVAQELLDKINEKGFVGKITKRETLVSEFLKLIKEISGIVNIATSISIFVALLFIFTGSNLGIMEREGEYATLKSIGYEKKPISRIIISESMFLAVVSGLVSIPFAVFISIYLNHIMSKAWFSITNFYFIFDFAKIIIPMLILIPFSVIPGLRHIFRLNITEALKTRIIE